MSSNICAGRCCYPTAVYGAEGTETFYQVFTGLSTVFPEGKAIKFDDIRFNDKVLHGLIIRTTQEVVDPNDLTIK